MKTPIVDFVKNYIDGGMSRFHMPGHKGEEFLGFEKFDITEIKGADVLSQAEGIIGESEENATALFGTEHSFYVTQGSSAAICAMLALVKSANGKTTILAARNVHKAFVNACALLDMDVRWLMAQGSSGIVECMVRVEMVEEELNKNPKPSAVYLTSPDYLGNIQDIQGISKVCKKYGVPLLVDNAHGAYLKFLDESRHPMDMGADVCCDSAHKTLPVLTGGAYLHISKTAPEEFVQSARGRIALFSSTSPSYLIMQSLDLCNLYLETNYRIELAECINRINHLKDILRGNGFSVEKDEPLKITIDAYKSGYCGEKLAEILRENHIEPEFYDNDFLVLMATPQNSGRDFERLENIFSQLKADKGERKPCGILQNPVCGMSIRDAVFAKSKSVDVDDAEGRICAELTVSCPPAVPIAVCGEIITKEAIEIFKYYGIETVSVVE